MIDFLVLVLILVAINSIVAIGFNIQWGYTGLLNLSSITFVGIGGYVAMVVALPPPGTVVCNTSWDWDGRFLSLFLWRWSCARCWAQSSAPSH